MTRSIRRTLSLLWIAGFLGTMPSPVLAGQVPSPALSRPPAIQTVGDSWQRLGPPARCWGPSAVFDPIRNRMVAFGGSPINGPIAGSFDVAWELSLTGTPSWRALTATGAGPPGRESFSAIYDPVRDRMIVFGGTGSATTNDVWALSLSGTPTWTQLSPSGTAPIPRRGHTAIYDPIRDRMVVFAGNDASLIDHNDLWALSLGASPAWTPLAPAGTPPSIRGWHSAIYDPVRDRMVVFAGYLWATSASLNDTWSLSLSGTPTWSPLAASGTPNPRNSHAAIYDPAGDRMVSFGGWGDPGSPGLLSVLTFSGSPAWSQVTPSGTPPPVRDGASGIYDAPNQRMVIFAGLGWEPGPGYEGDFINAWTVTLSGSPAWSVIAPTGTTGARQGPIVYDSVRERMVLIATFAEVFFQSMATEPAWSKVVPTGDPPPWGAPFSAIYDPVRDRVVLYLSTTDPAQIWALNFGSGASWSQIATSGTPPSYRFSHSTMYDPVRDRLVIHGGAFGDWFLRHTDVWALSFGGGGGSWSDLTPGGTIPVGRQGHTAIYDSDRDQMVICGGNDGFGTFRRDVWGLDFGTGDWAPITPAVSLPNDRVWMTAIYDAPRERMLMFGGYDPASAESNELWSLSLDGAPVWTQLTPPGLTPPIRQQHGTFYDAPRDRMVIYGGTTSIGNLDDTWAFTAGATVSVPEASRPGRTSLALAPPRPNPSREGATLDFTLARSGPTTLEVFDTSGRRVRTVLETWLPAGPHTATWRGDDDRAEPVRSGLYFVRLRCNGEEVTQRVVRAF